jgi:hypothetical protein
MTGLSVPTFPASSDERRDVGSYEKTFVVDGAEYELYAQLDGESGYQLVDRMGRAVGEFAEIPDDETVVALVREATLPEAG